MSPISRFNVLLSRMGRFLFLFLFPFLASGQEVLQFLGWPENSGHYTSTVHSSFSGSSTFEEWEFNAETGDALSVRLEADNRSARPRIQLRNLGGTSLVENDGDSLTASAELRDFRLSTPGTYRIRVSATSASTYRMRVDLARGPQLEIEPNHSVDLATTLFPQTGTGQFSFNVAGALDRNDFSGDFFDLGVTNSGNTILAEINTTAPSTLERSDLRLRFFDETGTKLAELSGETTTAYTTGISGPHYLQVAPASEAGKALNFNGDDDIAYIPHTALHGRDQFTAQFWLQPNRFVNQSIFSAANSRNDNAILFYLISDTRFRFHGGSSSNSYVDWDFSSIGDGGWHHFTITRDGIANTLELFINGISVGSRSLSMPTLEISENALLFGQDQDSVNGGFDPSQALNGKLDEFRLWSSILTASEIEANFDHSVDGTEANLIGAWSFDEPNGDILVDSGPNNLAGSLGNDQGMGTPTRIDSTIPFDFGFGLDARYFLTLTIFDPVAPELVETTLPAHDAASTDIIEKFGIHFSEDMEPATVSDTSNYELRAAGPDGLLGTEDDYVYTIAQIDYVSGASAQAVIGDGPLQPGPHRFSANTNLTDRAGNPLASAYAEEFTVTLLDGIFQFETANNDTRKDATTLSLIAPGDFDRSFQESLHLPMPSNPVHLNSADLNNDGNDDLIITNHGANSISIQLGKSDGTFADRLDYPVGTNPYQTVIADFNGDRFPDLAVVSESPNIVTVFLNNGDGTFVESATYSVGSNPRAIAVGDLNGDGAPDLVTANRSGHSYSVLLNNGDGTFAEAVSISLPGNWDPRGIAIGDLTGDGNPDLVLANYASHTASIHPGNGDGTFGEPILLDSGNNPESVAVADIDGDGFADIAILPTSGVAANIYLSTGNGNFSDRLDLSLGNSTTNREIRLTDIDGDGQPDLLISRGNTTVIHYNSGNGSFLSAQSYNLGSSSYSSVSGDFTNDGIPDIATLNYGNNRVVILKGLPEQSLRIDPVASQNLDLSVGAGRGSLSDAADIDYWKFSGKAGWRIVVATETPGHPNSTQLRYIVERPDGGNLLDFISASNGTNQVQTTLPVDGTYFLRVSRYNIDYFGEYNFRITLAPAEWQVESENNNNVNQANQLNLSFNESENVREAQMVGYLHHNDSGDFFRIANLSEGSTIHVIQSIPESSNLVAELAILAANGTLVASEAPGIGALSHTIGSGEEEVFYLRITGEPRGLFSQYAFSVRIEDNTPPRIVSDTLPAEESIVDLLFNHFSLRFSEDMSPGSINGVSAYELRRAATDGGFGADDEFYSIALHSVYATGLTANYYVADGPLQPGEYRFTVFPVLQDTSNNTLTMPYVRHFTVAENPDFILVNRNSNDPATATSLSLLPPGDFNQSFLERVQLPMPSDPVNVQVADLDSDGMDDLIVTNRLGNSISIQLGNGDGTFSEPADYPVGSDSYQTVIGDFNNDGFPDFAVASEGPNSVAVFLNNGNGTFTGSATYSVGGNPRGIAVGDLNNDGAIDLVTANRTGNSYSVLLNNNDDSGTFTESLETVLPGNWNPNGIAIADLTGDGYLDLVLANRNTNTASLHPGNGDGTFDTPILLDSGNNPVSVALGDIDGDGLVDIAILPSGGSVANIYLSSGNGGFEKGADIALGGSGNNREIRLIDIDGDGRVDLLVSRANVVAVRYNSGDGGNPFGPAQSYNIGGNAYSAAIGDFNSDSLPDITAVNQTNNRVIILEGLPENRLRPDLVGSADLELVLGSGRGALSDSSDVDYWKFSGKAGWRVILAAEPPNRPSNSTLRYAIERPDGGELISLTTSSGQTQATLPIDGLYYVRISTSNNFFGEYNFRITLVPPEWQLEIESNNNTSQADNIALTSDESEEVVVHRGQWLGYLHHNDPGDFFRLGNLAEGTEIRLRFAQPNSSDLNPTIGVLDGAGNVVAQSDGESDQLIHLVGLGTEGTYFVRLTGEPRGLFAQYLVWLEMRDMMAPRIVSDSLPAEGADVDLLFNRFTLQFSEDLDPVTVNDVSAYELRRAESEREFGTDDEFYTIGLASAYSSGLSANYVITDGPLQSGDYRFTVFPALRDISGNTIADPYIRHFTITENPDFVLQNRNSSDRATATSLSLLPPGDFDGSFVQELDLPMPTNPRHISVTDLTGNGEDDLIIVNHGANSISVQFGNGDGTFAERVDYPVGTNPYEAAIADFNNDGFPDIAVVSESPNLVTIFLNNGDGKFSESSTYSVGSNPRAIAVGDLNENGAPDLVVANHGNPSSYSVLLNNNDGNGTFAEAVTIALPGNWQPRGIALGDVTGDGNLDLVLANYFPNTASVHPGNGDGTFADPILLDSGNSPGSVAVGDINGDGLADIAILPGSGSVANIYLSDKNGEFAEPFDLSLGNSTTNREIRLTDIDGDGRPDLLVSRGNSLTILHNINDRETSFSPAYNYDIGGTSFSAASGDFNGDGLPDIVAVNQTNHRVSILKGLPENRLSPDLVGSENLEILLGAGRGALSETSDINYWKFSGKAGWRIIIAVEPPNRPSNSALRYVIERPDGGELFALNTSNGQNQATLPVDGVYYLRVSTWNNFFGEYNFRITLAPPEWQLEAESNNNISQANNVAFEQIDGVRQGQILGYLHHNDSGDFFRLGNLDADLEIRIAQNRPESSELVPIVAILDSSGNEVATGSAGEMMLTHTVAAREEGTYYLRITGNPRGLFSQYLLRIELDDSTPPTIVSDTFPPESAITTDLVENFSLTFSEDMDPDTVNDLANFDLRRAGPDELFGTSDDIAITLVPGSTYTSGLGTSFQIQGGSLQPGRYRFIARSTLSDVAGNPMVENYERYFDIVQIPGFTTETEPNHTLATATILSMEEHLPGLISGAARGQLPNSSDNDYWTFEAEAGDLFILATENPGNPNNSRLHYYLYSPSGSLQFNSQTATNGTLLHGPIELEENGWYAVRIARNQSYSGEYRFRISLYRGDLMPETESNDAIASATPARLTFDPETNRSTGRIGGMIRPSHDLDYIALGTVEAGMTVFLDALVSSGSPLSPTVSLYDAEGNYLEEAVGGRPFDKTAQVEIRQAGDYFALVRANGDTGGLLSEYVLQINILPTGDLIFPNLQVTDLTVTLPPTLESGDGFELFFEVSNVGSAPSEIGTWFDRAVLSRDTIYGNEDDLELSIFPRNGILGAGQSYTVTSTVQLPDGISGEFYVLVMTDYTDVVEEYFLEGDNVTWTDDPLTIALADYPDLVVENLDAGEPDGAGNYKISWETFNRGTATAGMPFVERFIIRNLASGTIVHEEFLAIDEILAPNQSNAQTAVATVIEAGNYRVEVTTDARNVIFEHDGISHETAERNTFVSDFSITRFFEITLEASPADGGTVSGEGIYPQGATVNLSATADTSLLPYRFSHWAEEGIFRSGNANYEFTAVGDRHLHAVFRLPNYLIVAQSIPAVGGTISGGGSHPHGSAIELVANPNPGYLFSHWTENGATISQDPTLSFSAVESRSFTAHFDEANPEHVVTTATLPTGIATIAGAGVYENGETGTFTAPKTIVIEENEYLFERFTLNGALITEENFFTKTFSTLDPAEIELVAIYRARSLLPVIESVTASHAMPVRGGVDFTLEFRFDREMNAAIMATVEFLNEDASVPADAPAAGSWIGRNTFATAPIQFVSENDGTYTVRVSGGTDADAREMEIAENVFSFTVDATPPEHPKPILTAVEPSAVTVDWRDYEAPEDLNAFRFYLKETPFLSLNGLESDGGAGPAATHYTFRDLLPDTDYHIAVAAVDAGGNMNPEIESLPIRIESKIPPVVAVTLTSPNLTTARLNWNGYPADTLLGFDRFEVYAEEEPFASIDDLTPAATLGANVFFHEFPGLDRTRSYWFAVVGVNRLDESISEVTPVIWTDPLAGEIDGYLVIGGDGETEIDVLNSVIVPENATLEIAAGTILRFAPATGLEIDGGTLTANGTALAPIHFTAADPEAGFAGISVIRSDSSALRHVWILHGSGLKIDASTPHTESLRLAWNDPAGLIVTNGSAIALDHSLVLLNETGIALAGNSTAVISGSVIKNNVQNATASMDSHIDATGNWWGTTDSAVIAESVEGAVDIADPLISEPILDPAFATASGSPDTGGETVLLRLAAPNAVGFRLSEDSTFAGVPFSDVEMDADSADLYTSEPFEIDFGISVGGGLKTVFAQFLGISGEISDPLSLAINRITDGPAIDSFNLTEGQQIHRPITVVAKASSDIGIRQIDFHVNGILQNSVPGGSFSEIWDMRGLSRGTHRVRLVVTDLVGNFATRELNVTLGLEPPIAPIILSPGDDAIFSVSPISVSGTAEPFTEIRLSRNNSSIGTVLTDSAGEFLFPTVPLVEGENELIATSFDAIGSTSSAPIVVELDTGPPAPVVLEDLRYDVQKKQLELQWRYSESGDRASRFQVIWHDEPFTDASQATGQSQTTTKTIHSVKNLPDGAYYFAVVGFDRAGNSSDLSNLLQINFDKTPPAFGISYDRPMPIGPGQLGITLTSTEPLTRRPTLTIRPNGFSSPISVTLSQSSPTVFSGTYLVTSLSAASGKAEVRVSGTDVAGNSFSGKPSGVDLVFDLTSPTGSVTIDGTSPIQVAGDVEIDLVLELSKLPAPGTTPELSFTPPTGPPVNVILTGEGPLWSGTLTLKPEMETGIGSFRIRAIDLLGNEGNNVTEGEDLEIYTAALPPAPAIPTDIRAISLPDGEIRLTWNPSDKAETYAIYRGAGAGGEAPEELLISELQVTEFIDLPSEDGIYRYVVTATRLGAESGKSVVVNGTSDRLPPGKPENLEVILVAKGVQLTWDAPTEGETPALYRVYRNSQLIRTVNSPIIILDSPPRGLMTYEIAGVDSVGNENLSDPASIELFVDAVNDLHVHLEHRQAPVMWWSSSDPSTVGFNVHRNGILQNASLLTSPTFRDQLPLGNAVVTYSIHAQNADGKESAARTVTVFPSELEFTANPDQDGIENDLITHYFERYRVALTNLEDSSPWPIENISIKRSSDDGKEIQFTQATALDIAPGETITRNFVFPGVPTAGAIYGFTVEVEQATDIGGSRVSYGRTFAAPEAHRAPSNLAVTASELPLAGGLNTFQVRIFNHGYAEIDVVLSRANGSQPGDLSISVINSEGEEVARTPFAGMASGIIFGPDGRGFVRIEPGSSTVVSVPNVLVPESLADERSVQFRADITEIRHGIGTPDERVSGPLSGSMNSSLEQTPYYATAVTNQSGYANREPIVISGQAIDRATDDAFGEAPLKIGFSARGFTWYEEVETDADGNFIFEYSAPAGFAGELTIWAAHPDIFDRLNQVTVQIYRMMVTPAAATIRASKNDTLDFNLTLINPGEIPLTNLAVSSRVYRIEDGEEIEVPEISVSLSQPVAQLVANVRERISLRMQADLNAPDDAIAEIIFTSAEGASVTFIAEVSLLPAIPILTVVSPRVGYVQGSVDRGDIYSRQVTIENRGLRNLHDVEITTPQEIPWMQTNLPRDADGKARIPDLAVGETFTFDVVFVPPTDIEMGYYLDELVISGSNAMSDFTVQVAAIVTSNLQGNLTALVTNSIGQRVPNASLRLRHSVLGHDLDPVMTDSEGRLTVSDLSEGSWSWHLSAPGHSAQAGVVEIQADETAEISAELHRSLVTITFNVVPVPFTDRYEIKLEMTFETFVPAPVLVVSPPQYTFSDVQPGLEATLMFTAKNEGLVRLFDVEISGSEMPYGRLVPMIEYLPELRPQESVQIPFRLEYYGLPDDDFIADENHDGMMAMRSGGGLKKMLGDCAGAASPFPSEDFLRGLAALVQGMYESPTSNRTGISGQHLAVGLIGGLIGAGGASPLDFIGGFLGQFLGCMIGSIIGTDNLASGSASGSAPEYKSRPAVGVASLGCFAAGTPVLLPNGSSIAIEQLRAGDKVLSNLDAGFASTIRHIYKIESEELYRLTVAPVADRSTTGEILVTGEHRIWTDGNGWMAARDLKPGEWLHSESGQMMTVTSLDPIDGIHDVYTFQLQGDSAFYAGSILVEDLCGGLYLANPESLKEVTE